MTDEQSMKMMMELLEQVKKKDAQNEVLINKVTELSKRVEELSKIPKTNYVERERSLSQIQTSLVDVGNIHKNPETSDLLRKAVDYIMFYGKKQSHLS